LGKIVNLSQFRLKKEPVRYTIEFTHDERGFYFWVRDTPDDKENRIAIAADLEAAAKSLLTSD